MIKKTPMIPTPSNRFANTFNKSAEASVLIWIAIARGGSVVVSSLLLWRRNYDKETVTAVMDAADLAIVEINADLGYTVGKRKSIKLVEVEKAVTTHNWLILLTLKVTKPYGDIPDTIQAIVYEGVAQEPATLEQWRFKPATA